MSGLFGEPISVYTRTDALADGTLIDVSSTAKEAGIKFPVAITDAAFTECVTWNPDNRAPQDLSGRLWDVVWMLRQAIRSASGTEILYTVLRVPNKPRATRAEPVRLKALCHGGDHAEPVITIMLPDED